MNVKKATKLVPLFCNTDTMKDVFRCMHWDVNNENMIGDFFERGTGDVNITMSMFEQMHAVDSEPLLFLNEKDAVVDTQLAVVCEYM